MTALFYGWGIIGILFIFWGTFANAYSWLRPRYRAWKQLRKDIRNKLHGATLSPEWYVAHNQAKESKEEIHARQLARLHAEEEATRVREESRAGTVDPNWKHPPGYWPPPVTDEQFDDFLDRVRSKL